MLSKDSRQRFTCAGHAPDGGQGTHRDRPFRRGGRTRTRTTRRAGTRRRIRRSSGRACRPRTRRSRTWE